MSRAVVHCISVQPAIRLKFELAHRQIICVDEAVDVDCAWLTGRDVFSKQKGVPWKDMQPSAGLKRKSLYMAVGYRVHEELGFQLWQAT